MVGPSPSQAAGASNGSMMPAITDEEIEQREKALRENLARNFGRVHELEHELAQLQLELRMNIGPKKQAMEMLRKKIEEQSVRVSSARAVHEAAKIAFDTTEDTLKREEDRKEQLCEELKLLVQQANRSQLEKLEQLTARLEFLGGGVGGSGGASNSNESAAASALRQDAEALKDALAASIESPQPQQQKQPEASTTTTTREAAVVESVSPKDKANAEAAAARGRHVSLTASRGRGRTTHVGSLTKVQPPQEARDEKGNFRGFE